MRRCALVLFIGSILCSPAAAQLNDFNPYARTAEEPAIRQDGTINWPPFFKSAKTEARFQMYFDMGSCRGTKESINQKLRNNTVNVNALPKATVKGRVARVVPGGVGVIDSTGKTALVVMHPRGVSRISVAGSVSPAAIQAGVTVRLQAQVDAQGRGVDPVQALEVITPHGELKPTEVEPDRVQTIVGAVTRRRGDVLRINTGVGRLRFLTFVIAADATASVDGSSLNLLSVGDDVTAEGHSYSGEGTLADRTIFADDLDVAKHAPVTSSP